MTVSDSDWLLKHPRLASALVVVLMAGILGLIVLAFWAMGQHCNKTFLEETPIKTVITHTITGQCFG